MKKLIPEEIIKKNLDMLENDLDHLLILSEESQNRLDEANELAEDILEEQDRQLKEDYYARLQFNDAMQNRYNNSPPWGYDDYNDDRYGGGRSRTRTLSGNVKNILNKISARKPLVSTKKFYKLPHHPFLTQQLCNSEY